MKLDSVEVDSIEVDDEIEAHNLIKFVQKTLFFPIETEFLLGFRHEVL